MISGGVVSTTFTVLVTSSAALLEELLTIVSDGVGANRVGVHGINRGYVCCDVAIHVVRGGGANVIVGVAELNGRRVNSGQRYDRRRVVRHRNRPTEPDAHGIGE